ncbi:MAG: FAD-dependent oxidoreductase [Clostridia bacterium]|nr:FAD-dependent oxidoreductase [Clostridia bacterium]
MKKTLSLILVVMMVMTCGISAAFADGYHAGTYEGVGKGNNGEVKVSVTFSDDQIVRVEVSEHAETPGVSDPAIERIPADIVAQQSLAVDTVSGATNTSNAILTAVADAVAQAGGDVEALQTAKAEAAPKAEQQEETEILVIGGGMAGMAAALEAVQKGAKVTLIEKNAATGGTLAIAGGYLIACDADIFDSANVADSLEDFRKAWEAHMAYSGVESGYPDWERWESVVGDTGKTVDWLAESGVSFEEAPYMGFDGGAYPVAKHVKAGAGMAAEMVDMLVKAGVDVRTETKAIDLVTDETGAVIGAVAETKDAKITFAAKAVILATGGISQNEELVAQYSPKIHQAGVVSGAASGSTGDGLLMAEKVGAEVFDSFFSALWNAKVAPEVSKAIDASKLTTAAQLGVNAKGLRFASESAVVYKRGEDSAAVAGSYVDGLASDMIQDGNAPFYYIYDAANEEITAVLEQGVDAGVVYKADTIEALAAEIGVDAAALKETYEAYKTLCEAGEDTQFGKAADNMIALTVAPFYAVQWTPTTFGSTGGVKTDLQQRVLKADGSFIPGLYAAGEMSNRYFYNENYMLGASLGLYATCGRRAGASAVEDMTK